MTDAQSSDKGPRGVPSWLLLLLVLLALVPSAYLFVTGNQQRTEMEARTAAAESAAQALADSLDAARTQLLVDRVLVLARAGQMNQAITALTLENPEALQLIEEIAALHLPLGDPAMGARVPTTPVPDELPAPGDTARSDPDSGRGIDTTRS